MARHSLFPNSITIHYTTNAHDHLMVLPVGVVAGSAPGWTLPVRTGSPVDWRDAVDAFALLLASIIKTDGSFDYAELFTYEATDSPAEFLAAHTIDQDGLSSSSTVPFVQSVFPFKAVGGNSLRLTVLEGVNAANIHQPYSSVPDDGNKDILDFILSDDDWIITRGGTYPND
jgi:hypothetical protein